MSLTVNYVVLYVDDAELCRTFWVEKVGMVEKDRTSFGEHVIVKVGFADQPFSFELVPLAMMADNPDGLDLATPRLPCARLTSRPPEPLSSHAVSP